MGVFDSVIAKCPCGAEVEFQSKAMPEPYLHRFPVGAVPMPLVIDLHGSVEECVACHRRIRLLSPYWVPRDGPYGD